MSPRNGKGALSNGTNAVIGSRNGPIGIFTTVGILFGGAALAGATMVIDVNMTNAKAANAKENTFARKRRMAQAALARASVFNGRKIAKNAGAAMR